MDARIDNAVFVGMKGRVSAQWCDKADGGSVELWRTKLPGFWGSGVVTVLCVAPDDRIYATSGDKVYSLDRRTGTLIWSTGKAASPGLNGAFNATLLAIGTYLLVAGKGAVACLNRVNGQLIWENDLRGAGYYSVTMRALLRPDGQVGEVLACTNGRICALSLFDGREVWRWASKMPTSVSVIQDTIGVLHVGCGGRLHWLDPTNGSQIGEFELKGSGIFPVGIAMSNGVLFAATWGHLWAFDALSHRMLWKNELKGCRYGYGLSVVPLPNLPDGTPGGVVVGIASRVVFISAQGVVRKITELGGGNAHVSFVVVNGLVFASSAGRLFGFTFEGDCVIRNELPGLGWGCLTTTTLYDTLDFHSCPVFGDFDQMCKS